jgi:hypothetical protein
MKKLLSIFTAVLFASFIMTSCSGASAEASGDAASGDAASGDAASVETTTVVVEDSSKVTKEEAPASKEVATDDAKGKNKN